MIIGVLSLRLKIGYAQSLKDKRRVIKSLIARAKNQVNVSISEVGDLDSWHYATIGAAIVTNEAAHANQVLDRLVQYVESFSELEVVTVEKELL